MAFHLLWFHSCSVGTINKLCLNDCRIFSKGSCLLQDSMGLHRIPISDLGICSCCLLRHAAAWFKTSLPTNSWPWGSQKWSRDPRIPSPRLSCQDTVVMTPRVSLKLGFKAGGASIVPGYPLILICRWQQKNDGLNKVDRSSKAQCKDGPGKCQAVWRLVRQVAG